jgi:small conductance mechanosensitive channel
MQYDVGIGYGDDIEHARGVILDALTSLEGIARDPAPDCLVVALADWSVTLRARWWGESHMGDALKGQDVVLSRIKQRLAAAAVDLPFPTQVVLWHGQTEETDGDRRRQREGWPAGDGPVPAAARTLRMAEPRTGGLPRA